MEEQNVREYHSWNIFDMVFLRAWTYVILPLPVLYVLYLFLTSQKVSLNGEAIFALLIYGGIAFGLHKRKKWAWYANCFLIFALAAIPTGFAAKEYGAIGGILGGLWSAWLFTTWYRLKELFFNSQSKK